MQDCAGLTPSPIQPDLLESIQRAAPHLELLESLAPIAESGPVVESGLVAEHGLARGISLATLVESVFGAPLVEMTRMEGTGKSRNGLRHRSVEVGSQGLS